MPSPAREGVTLTSGQQGLTRLLLVNGRVLSRSSFSRAPITLRWKRKFTSDVRPTVHTNALQQQRRNLKKPAFCFRLDRKHFERPHDNDVISRLPEFLKH